MSRVKFLAKFWNLNFWQFFKICNFDFILFWLGIWCEPLVWVMMGRWGVSQNAGVLVVLIIIVIFDHLITTLTTFMQFILYNKYIIALWTLFFGLLWFLLLIFYWVANECYADTPRQIFINMSYFSVVLLRGVVDCLHSVHLSVLCVYITVWVIPGLTQFCNPGTHTLWMLLIITVW